MQQSSTISVIMPVFNRERMVVRSVQSILAQDFTDFECIIVDDGSTDGTVAAIRALADKRVVLVPLPVNAGIAAARNIGLNLARGEFIATMDSDDVAMPDRLSRQLAYLQAHPDVDIVGSDIVKVQGNLRMPQEKPRTDGAIKARLLTLDGGGMIHPTMMLRRAFLNRTGLRYPAVPTDVDHAFWIEAMVLGARFATVPGFLLDYHRHAGNVTAETAPRYRQHETRKTPMRARLLGLFFPALTHGEAAAIARWMEAGRQHSIPDVCAAVSAIRKAAAGDASHWGESRAELRGIMDEVLGRALAALSRQVGQAALA